MAGLDWLDEGRSPVMGGITRACAVESSDRFDRFLPRLSTFPPVAELVPLEDVLIMASLAYADSLSLLRSAALPWRCS